MRKYLLLAFILIEAGICGCGVVRDTPKYSFSNGYYSAMLPGHARAKVYVENIEDSIFIYPLASGVRPLSIDTVKQLQLAFPAMHVGAANQSYLFRQTSFDVDFLTTPFKIRPAGKSLPAQFNTNLNGVVFLGYRSDLYRLGYRRNPLNHYNRQISHYAFSFGAFTGFGGTDISEHVTEGRVASEYSGVVWSKGIAGIIGINNATIGLVTGWDNLLDANRKYWIYQGKPWIGFAFGLNLN